MMRSRAPVHWGRCWTEAPVAGIAMGIAWILGGGAARFSAITRALFVGQGLKTPIFREGNKMKKQAGGSICAK
jgi:hypothetical protein